MTKTLSEWASEVHRLDAALDRLAADAERLGSPSSAEAEWRQLLKRKILPQLAGDPWLVVAVIGGTNIGKSSIFNMLAGETASGVSATAAGTKHPLCLAPRGHDDQAFLDALFDGFDVRPWTSSQDPLIVSNDDLLFWRTSEHVPTRLLLLDSPDIDSDAKVNWRRARAIRQASDLLIAVLTQQKYNDAAVKQFFREAAEADKPVVVLFNQCDLEHDAEHWPQWLATFLDETGCSPEMVGVLPWDRAAANEARLPVRDVGLDGRQTPTLVSLREQIASMRFETIKVRALRGALRRVVDESDGVGGYLTRLVGEAKRFSDAATVLSASEMVKVDWPMLPTPLLVGEIRDWWDEGRPDWSRKIHGFYRTLGQGMIWPIKYAWNAVREGGVDPVEKFHADERGAIVAAVGKLLDELQRLAEIGNDALRPRILGILGGRARERLLEDVRAAHEALPDVDDDYRRFLRKELDAWREGSPASVRFMRALDHVGALARPAITVSLAVGGFMFAGEILGQAAAHLVSHAATEAAIAGGVTGGGEAVVTGASEGVRHAAARLFVRLQREYAEQRAQWLADWLESELLGDLLSDLQFGASLPKSEAFTAADEIASRLRDAVR